MFEVVVSQVKTGRVERMLFDTRDEAETALKAVEERLTNPPAKWSESKQQWVPQKAKSLRDYRFEIHFRDCPAVLAMQPKAKIRAALAA